MTINESEGHSPAQVDPIVSYSYQIISGFSRIWFDPPDLLPDVLAVFIYAETQPDALRHWWDSEFESQETLLDNFQSIKYWQVLNPH